MRKTAATVVVAGLIMGSCGNGSAAPPERGPEPAETVVQVLGEICRRDAQGSGVIIDEGLVLTSAHAVAGAEGGLLARRPEGTALPAKLVGFDPNRDLAVLNVPGIGGTPSIFAVPTADTEGYIGTVDVDGRLELLSYTVDRLIVANSGDIYDDGEVVRSALQLSAATLPGDSGGALFDENNRVVGIVFAQSRQTDDLAYAVATSEVEAFLADVDTSTEVEAGRCP